MPSEGARRRGDEGASAQTHSHSSASADGGSAANVVPVPSESTDVRTDAAPSASRRCSMMIVKIACERDERLFMLVLRSSASRAETSAKVPQAAAYVSAVDVAAAVVRCAPGRRAASSEGACGGVARACGRGW